MTKRDFFELVIAGTQNDEMVEFAKSEIEKMNARNANRASKPSKTQIANEPIIAKIGEYLANANGVMTAKEIAMALDLTPQKVSALVKKVDGVEVSEVVVDKRVVKGYRIA